MSASDSWEVWFDAQYDLCQRIEALIAERCEGKSSAYRVAIHAAVIEGLSEGMRSSIELPDSDGDSPTTSKVGLDGGAPGVIPSVSTPSAGVEGEPRDAHSNQDG